MSVAVVTDSTAYLPAELIEGYGIHVVPLYVVLAGTLGSRGPGRRPRGRRPRAGRPRPDASPPRGRRRATSSPPTGAALDAGADRIVSIHLSGELSEHLGRRPAGRLAGRRAPRDRRRLALGGHGRAASRCSPPPGPPPPGADAAEVAETARRTAARDPRPSSSSTPSSTCAGAGGSARRPPSSARRSRSSPCCTCRTAGSCPLEKVRTAARALNRLVQRAVEAAGDGPVSVAVHHLAAAGAGRTAGRRNCASACRRCANCTSASSARRSVRTSGPARSASSSRRSGSRAGRRRTRRRATARGGDRRHARQPAPGGAGRCRPPSTGGGRIHRSSGRPVRRAAGSLASDRCASPPAAATTPTSSARACGRCSRRRSRARGWLPDDDLTRTRTADDWDDDDRSPVPVGGPEPDEPALPAGLGRHRAPGPHGALGPGPARAPGRCGSPAWSPPSLLVAWTWLDRPQVEPVPAAAGRERAVDDAPRRAVGR